MATFNEMMSFFFLVISNPILDLEAISYFILCIVPASTARQISVVISLKQKTINDYSTWEIIHNLLVLYTEKFINPILSKHHNILNFNKLLRCEKTIKQIGHLPITVFNSIFTHLKKGSNFTTIQTGLLSC